MFRPRAVTARLERMFSTFPVVVLSGARQVGKSTLLSHVFGSRARSVVFDPVLDVERARQDPELFLESHPPPLILDEIQYAPEVVAALKRRVDRARRPGMYLVTGSQQWSVMKSLAESLAGRVVFLDLEGFSLAELAPGRGNSATTWLQSWIEDPEGFAARPPERLPLLFPLPELLWRGFLPTATEIPGDLVAAFHSGYLRTYVERDVRALAEVSDQQLFARFFRLVAAHTGQEIKERHLGRELGIAPQTAGRWMDILRATFQWFELPAWTGNARTRVTRLSKGHVADAGVACHALGLSSPDALLSHPAWGAVFETAVLAEIRKACACLAAPPRLHHWRSHSGAEVDLVMERDGQLYPVEIKATSRITGHDARGMRALRDKAGGTRVGPGLVIVPTGPVGRLGELDLVVPWDLGGGGGPGGTAPRAPATAATGED